MITPEQRASQPDREPANAAAIREACDTLRRLTKLVRKMRAERMDAEYPVGHPDANRVPAWAREEVENRNAKPE